MAVPIFLKSEQINMMTRIKNTDYFTRLLLTKTMLYSCVMSLTSKMALKYFKPAILALTSVFLISACGGGSDVGVETTPAPTPAPAPAPSPTPSPTPTPTPAANIAPTVDAGADQSINAQTAVVLSGIGTDIDGTVTSYAWSQIAGASVTLVNADSATTSFDAPSSTTELILTFQLVVSDDDGATATDTIDINVNAAANEGPRANAGTDQTVDAQTAVTLSGSGTDSDGSVVSYRWMQTSGEAVSLANADSATTSFDAPSSSTELVFTFQLTITDDGGASATDTVDITVEPLSAAPLTVTANNDNNDLVVSWNDVSADLYRVLFWDNEGNVYGPTTTSLSLSIAATIRELGGTLVVEAYDVLGNSVFSARINVESL
ncbi:MAG: hypothetical protein ACI9MS_002203 [Glaciecola sp.]